MLGFMNALRGRRLSTYEEWVRGLANCCPRPLFDCIIFALNSYRKKVARP